MLLEATLPTVSSLVTCTSTGARPKSVCPRRAMMPLNTERPLLALDYPTTHFEALIAPLQQPLPSIISNVPSLLARLTAHSSSSGHIPPTHSSFRSAHNWSWSLCTALRPYLHSIPPCRECNGTSFVRWKDPPSNESSGSFGGELGSASSLRVPTCLKD